MLNWADVYHRLKERIEFFGVVVSARQLGFETTGVFDGLSIITNTDCDLETRCYNMAHSFGHIVQWSLDYGRQQALYDRLNAAKANRSADPVALEGALCEFRQYEEEASEYAAWLLQETGNALALPSFTVFARADIEAIVTFHRDGLAPIWSGFFREWKNRLARGQLVSRPFSPKPIPPFTPLVIGLQEVIQEVDGR